MSFECNYESVPSSQENNVEEFKLELLISSVWICLVPRNKISRPYITFYHYHGALMNNSCHEEVITDMQKQMKVKFSTLACFAGTIYGADITATFSDKK